MEPATVRVPARSRRQAMDWSLVLLSQGIEHTVERSEPAASWELQVAAQDNEKALEAIRLYQLENRHWPWRQRLFTPGVLFDWASVCWVILVCVFFGVSNSQPAMEAAGVMDTSAVARGESWRLFTAIWLHADLAHLASNAVFGFAFLGLAMGRYG